MKPKTKSIIQFVLLLGLGILLVWLAFSQVADEKDKIISAFTNADYFWVGVSSLIAFSSHVVRAYRWNYLLEPLGHKVSFTNSVAAVFVCYFANYGIPRMGEISRCTIVDRYEKVPFQVGFGTVVTERIVDSVLLLIIFGLTLLFQFTELIGLSNEYIFDPVQKKFAGMSSSKLMVIGAILLSLVIGFFAFRKKMATKLKGKFGGIIKGFLEGLSSIRKIKNFWSFAGLSVLIWTMYFYSSYSCMKALPETSVIGHKEVLAIMVFGTLGIVFTPGGLGAYHLIVAQILMYYGVAKAPAAALPWLIWTSQFIIITLMGLISLALLPVINKKRNVLPQQAN